MKNTWQIFSLTFFLIIMVIALVYAVSINESILLRERQELIELHFNHRESKHDSITVIVNPLKQTYLYNEEVWCEFQLYNNTNEVYKLRTPISSDGLEMFIINPNGEQIYPIGIGHYLDIGFEDVLPHSKSNKYIFSLSMFMNSASINLKNGVGKYTMFSNYQRLKSNISEFEVSLPKKDEDFYLYEKYNKIKSYQIEIDTNNPDVFFNDIIKHKNSAYAPGLYATGLSRLKWNNPVKALQYKQYLDEFYEYFSDSPELYTYIGTYDYYITRGKGEPREKILDVLDTLRQNSSSEITHSIIDMLLRLMYKF